MSPPYTGTEFKSHYLFTGSFSCKCCDAKKKKKSSHVFVSATAKQYRNPLSKEAPPPRSTTDDGVMMNTI